MIPLPRNQRISVGLYLLFWVVVVVLLLRYL